MVKEERELENSEPRNKIGKREGGGKELSIKNTKHEFHQMMVSCQILEARFFFMVTNNIDADLYHI